MKSGRQAAILDIISERNIETQFELLEALRERGVTSTQATLSRDIRDMRLVKETGADGRVRYVLPPKEELAKKDGKLNRIFCDSVTKVDIAQNLIVVKTLPGLAPAACSAIDSMEVDGLVGTIAGDDTAFIAMKDNSHAQRFYKEIESIRLSVGK